ncbi:MAG TPA: group II intron reverse transcriptase/maturase [Anaerolineales bacterium]|nr:group II intron reverse transcriptase/maturase [Anaerolineales bacterium]
MEQITEMPTEWCRIKVSELQGRLAKKATEQPEHRFNNLYDLLTWEPLMVWAFDTLMTNRGSRTAGIDRMDKRTAIENKGEILRTLKAALKSRRFTPSSVRRVYIPKPNGKQRPLGIPTLTDRLVQMMVKAILEPIFESDFYPSSHGFRPQRSCHTAMAYLHQQAAPKQKKMNWVIEGDIVGCFDHIQHKILIRLLKRRIQDQKLLALIWQMLKAGVMEGTLFKETPEGTPQGGIVSPLLANIYLHELDKWMDEKYTGLNYNEKNRRRKRKEGNAFYVRYADDFVIAWNGTKENAQKLKAELSAFLSQHLGLQLSEEKTHITHITEGFDFLGFTMKRHVDTQRGYNELKFYPSKKSVMKVKDKIKSMTKRGATLASVRDKITALNLLLRGWANYYRHSAASSTFSYVGSYAFKRMELWLRKKTRLRVRAVYRKYYRRKRWLTWEADGEFLYHPSETNIEYKRYAHLPNPYLDPSTPVYLPYHLDPYPGKREWDGTNSRYGENWTDTRDEIRQRDGQRCALCGSQDRVEVHHVRKHKGNSEHNPNRLIALCAKCHRKARNPQHEVSRKIARLYQRTGEPDEAKVSRPVLREA